MGWDLLIKALVAMTPVLVVLLAFDRLDIFNLIRFRVIVGLVLTGGAIAALAFFANGRVMDGFPIGFSDYSRYVAPIVEETLKALPVILLFAFNRMGYKLDTAIACFAIGAGFSMVENAWYLRELPSANLSAWLVRGFGTAIMHGGATALFGVISHEFSERQMEAAASKYRFNPLIFIPGWVVAILVHSLFNHFPEQPMLAMALTLLLVPITLFLVFSGNEKAARAWLAADKAGHEKALEDIRAGRFADSDAGRAIAQAIGRLKGVRAADVFGYLELKTELVLRAEELILAAQNGQPQAPTADDKAKFDRLAQAERSLGWSVLAAINPYVAFTRNDLWELGRLRDRVRKG